MTLRHEVLPQHSEQFASLGTDLGLLCGTSFDRRCRYRPPRRGRRYRSRAAPRGRSRSCRCGAAKRGPRRSPGGVGEGGICSSHRAFLASIFSKFFLSPPVGFEGNLSLLGIFLFLLEGVCNYPHYRMAGDLHFELVPDFSYWLALNRKRNQPWGPMETADCAR